MRVVDDHSNAPIAVQKSVRGEEIRSLTSAKAGKILPLAYVPLLREDRVSRGSVRVSMKMAETVHPLMNAVNVTVMAHFIPFLAFERFDGIDQFNRSYQGVNEPRGAAAPIPFFETVNFNKDHLFWKTLGIHWPNGQPVNSAPLEAFKTLVEYRRKVRSKHLEGLSDVAAAPAALPRAFWKNPNMYHIVPDFDQAALDGEVALNIVDAKLPIPGITRIDAGAGMLPNGQSAGLAIGANSSTLSGTGGVNRGIRAGKHSSGGFELEVWNTTAPQTGTKLRFAEEIFAEMQTGGITVSLSNIELAKKTAAFAKLRQQYVGMDDDHLIDLLMQGIGVPPESLKQPILLDRKSTIFGYTERRAMDGDNLDKSATTGATELMINFRTPAINTGGIILITAEIVPEQLFERMHDKFLGITSPDQLPDFTRDFLDPEKVDVVPNKHVDVLHATPNATLGYGPLNHDWKRSITRIGGRYYRPDVGGFVEDRQRFWSVETLNPTLNSDFYLCPENLPHTVFMDQIKDPFEILTTGGVEIVGNTVFGIALEEDNGDYDAVASKVDHTRIEQE